MSSFENFQKVMIDVPQPKEQPNIESISVEKLDIKIKFERRNNNELYK